MRGSSSSSVLVLVAVVVAALLAALQSSTPVTAQGLCGGTLANPGVCTPANNSVTPSAAAKAVLSKYTQIVHIYLTANSFDFLFGAYPGANNIQRALSNGLYNQQLTEAGYTRNFTVNAAANYTCLPCDTVGYITATTSPWNTSYCTTAGQAAGFCIPNAPFNVAPYLPVNYTWPNDPKHTFYATQYNDNGGAMNGFVWASGKVGAFGLGYYNLTGSYLFQLAQDYTLFDNFFQSAYGGVMVNHLYLLSAQIPTWNSTASPICPTSIFQNYSVNGTWVATTTTGLYPYDYIDAYGDYLPANDNSLFTPDCHTVENISPFTLGKSPNMPPLNNTHIGTLLTAANVSWAYYYQSWNLTKAVPVGAKTSAPVSLHENPFTFFQDFANLSSPYVMSHIKDDDQFYSDLANGWLANVTWVKPDQSDGFGCTDNNPAIGMVKLQSYMDAIYASSYWKNNQMMVILSFSDSDGLFDHVPPYTGDGYGPGDRVPTVVISPDTVGGKINSQPYETGSWLKMLGTRFGLPTNSLFNAARLQSTNDFTNIFTDPVTYSQGTPPTLSNGTAQVRWGYSLLCPNNTLDYPCLTQLVGTATINTTLLTATYSGATYSYYQMLNFTGTRTYTNRYGAQVVTPATLAPVGELNSNLNRLVLTATALGAGTPTFRLGNVIQFPSGLLGNEVELIVTTGYAIESITINASNTNSLNDDPSHVYICSTAPNFVASAYNATNEAAVFFNAMGPCEDPAPFAFQSQSPNNTALGLRTYAFTYFITDNLTFTAQVNATINTDGTVNYDALGNVYYNIIAISGTRYEQSLINTSQVSTVYISSLMAPNIIWTSNLAYITNNNRIYPQYPYLDRYGIAYTVTSAVGKVVANAEANDGALYSYSNIVGAYIYRLDTLDEQGLAGNWAYPNFNAYNYNQNQLTLTLLPNPSVYQLVTFCYVLYGLPNTLDYPWSVVVSGTGLINNTLVNQTGQAYTPGLNLTAYYFVGFVGTRTYTNRFGAQVVMALTLAQLNEDYNYGYIAPMSPYSPYNGIAFHLNGTFQGEGGLPMTDISMFQDPFPTEGTAFGYGLGNGPNTLNNDPSRTLFVSNMPGFTNSTYSNSNPATQLGTVAGTSDLTQCKASISTVQLTSGVTTVGLRVYSFIYSLTGTGGYTTNATLQLVTDGTVNVDSLGNYYYNVAAASGVRMYFSPNGSLLSNTTVTAVLPICSGPSVSNLDAVYCNNNRLYPQYPYMDRLGLALQLSATIPAVGSAGVSSSSVNQVGLLVYRSTSFEEEKYSTGGIPAFSINSTNDNFTLTMAAVSNVNNYQAVQWGYIVYCLTTALEYPCSVNVQGTAIIVGTTPVVANCSTNKYALCSQPAYTMVGFTGTRNFTNRYGETVTSNISSTVLGEDYADQLLYTVQPYVDGDGPVWRLNGTDGALTEVIGGMMTNEINFFLYSSTGNPTEGIAVNGAQSSALLYNASLTVVCSTVPGFTNASYNATTTYPAGSTSMAACLPSRAILGSVQTKPTIAQTVAGLTYTLGYSISDGATFTVQTVVTVHGNGQSYNDMLGNRYIFVVAANGTRTYYDWTNASSTPTSVAIAGVVTNSTFAVSSLSLTGNLNDNRLYPASKPYLDVLGLAFNLSAPAPATGSVSVTTSAIALVSYKDSTVEELPAGGKYPVNTYQTLVLNAGTVIPVLPNATRPSSSSPSSSSSAATSSLVASSSARGSSSATSAPISAASSAATSATVAASSARASSSVTSAATSPATSAPSTSTAASSSTAQVTSTPAATSASVSSSSTVPVVVSSASSGLSHGQIAGIVVGSVIGGLLLLCLCAVALWAAMGGKGKERPPPESESSKNISTLPTREPSQVGIVEMQPQTTNGLAPSSVEV